MVVALALAGIPIWMLIRPEEAAVVPPVSSPAAPERELTLEIQTAPAAQSLHASYLERKLIPANHEGGNYTGVIRLPTSAADLIVTASWEGTHVAALRVRTSNNDGPIAEASFWGTDEIEEVITIPAVQP
ncbi:MAG TPA: hypothetical protein VIT23_04100 [Terrimicrobiaceae bacterium]